MRLAQMPIYRVGQDSLAARHHSRRDQRGQDWCYLPYRTRCPTTSRGMTDMWRRKPMVIGYGRTSTTDQTAGLVGQERDLAIAKHLGSARSTVYRLLEPAQAA